jgi:hypothetical protein
MIRSFFSAILDLLEKAIKGWEGVGSMDLIIEVMAVFLANFSILYFFDVSGCWKICVSINPKFNNGSDLWG